MNKQFDEDFLVKKYTGLVRIIARKFYLAGAEQEDVIQEGMVGLLRAIRNYRDDQGASFDTFAEKCIKNQIKNAIKMANDKKHDLLNNSEPIDYLESIMGGKEKQTGVFKQKAGISVDEIGGVEDPETEIISREINEERDIKIAELLSPMEKKVLTEYLEGYGYEQIAEHLQTTRKSVDNAVQRIRKKLSNS